MIINVDNRKFFNHFTFFPLVYSNNVKQLLDDETKKLMQIVDDNIREGKLYLSAFDRNNIFLSDIYVTIHETDVEDISKYKFFYKDKEISTALLVLTSEARTKLINSSFIYSKVPEAPVLVTTPMLEGISSLNETQIASIMQIIAGVEKALTFCIME